MTLNPEEPNFNMPNYRSYVGPPDRYDFMGSSQFRLLTSLGLRSNHKLLDFGCGSLRAGRLYIPFLDKGNYYGQDPNQWLIDDGFKNELGKDIIDLKKPKFSNLDNFELGFSEKFDYILAQSIFSHTNKKSLKKGISSIFNGLKNDGMALITIQEGIKDFSGPNDWVYPGHTKFKRKTISKILNENTKYWKRLYWYHPGQTWYVLTKSKNKLPSSFDNFFLLGGEEINSQHYNHQHFFRNRLRRFLFLRRFVKFVKLSMR